MNRTERAENCVETSVDGERGSIERPLGGRLAILCLANGNAGQMGLLGGRKEPGNYLRRPFHSVNHVYCHLNKLGLIYSSLTCCLTAN